MMKITDLNTNTKYVIFINDKAVTEYVDTYDLKKDLHEIMKKYPNEKYDVRKISYTEEPVDLNKL